MPLRHVASLNHGRIGARVRCHVEEASKVDNDSATVRLQCQSILKSETATQEVRIFY